MFIGSKSGDKSDRHATIQRSPRSPTIHAVGDESDKHSSAIRADGKFDERSSTVYAVDDESDKRSSTIQVDSESDYTTTIVRTAAARRSFVACVGNAFWKYWK